MAVRKRVLYWFALQGRLASHRRRLGIEKKMILELRRKRRFPSFGQLKYLPQFLTSKERKLLSASSFLLVASLVVILVLGYFDITKEVPAEGGEYAEGIIGYPRFVNPLYSDANEPDKDIVALVYSGLLYRGKRGAFEEDLAESYKISDDEKVFTFFLRKAAFWHDGKPVTSDDVVFTINAIKNKAYNSPLRALWEDVGIQKIDEATVQFRLPRPSASFLTMLTVGILPKHIWERVPATSINLAEANVKPVGSGPYAFKSFVKDKVGVIKSYKLKIYPNYYGRAPFVKEITLKFFPDYVSAAGALDSRQIDGLAFAPAEALEVLKMKGRLARYEVRLPQFNAIFFNERNNSVLKDKAVRHALGLAVDRKRVLKEAAADNGVLIDGPILPGYLGYTDKVKKFAFDAAAAEKLLTDAGWTRKDGDKFRSNKKKEHLKIVLTTADKEENAKAAAIIKENWEKAGVEVELKIVGAADIARTAIQSRNYEALLYGEKYGSDLDPYQYWHSSARLFPGLNLAQYSARAADAALEQARGSFDRAVRQKKYEEFQLLLAEDFPVIFLWAPRYEYLIDEKLRGVSFNELAASQDRLRNLMEGYIKTKRSLK